MQKSFAAKVINLPETPQSSPSLNTYKNYKITPPHHGQKPHNDCLDGKSERKLQNSTRSAENIHFVGSKRNRVVLSLIHTSTISCEDGNCFPIIEVLYLNIVAIDKYPRLIISDRHLINTSKRNLLNYIKIFSPITCLIVFKRPSRHIKDSFVREVQPGKNIISKSRRSYRQTSDRFQGAAACHSRTSN